MALLPALLLASSPVRAQTAAPAGTAATPVTAPAAAAGMVKRVSGPAQLERAGQPPQPLVPGLTLQPGDTVRTGAGSGAGITLADDTLLTIGADSQLVIGEFSYNSTTQDGHILLRLWRGTLHVVTGLIARKSPEKVNVHTRSLVLGVRGTEFIVETTEQPL